MYDAKVYNVMIASPGDVVDEPGIARAVVHEWNVINAESQARVLMPTGWDTHSSPEMGDRAQGIINKQVLKNADLLIAVFWTRIGSPTGKAESGTVEEIEPRLFTSLSRAANPVLFRVQRSAVAPPPRFRGLSPFPPRPLREGRLTASGSPPGGATLAWAGPGPRGSRAPGRAGRVARRSGATAERVRLR